MAPNPHKKKSIALKVWVLAPHLITNDPNIDYYYDFTQSIAEYTKTFAELDMPWHWQPVTMKDYKEVIDTIAAEKESKKHYPIILNLCDGDEINGTPGVSVVKYLDEKELIYTGADEYFYTVTTSKISMKEAFDHAHIATPKWLAIHNRDQNLQSFFKKLGSPMIVKPSVSGGSMGVGIKNVVGDLNELNKQVQLMFDGYRGWDLTADGLIAESFICGPEFTTLIVGSYDKPEEAIIYNPVERVFHSSLPENEKFLSFDRLWEIYEEETPMPRDENFYEYQLPDASLIEEIKQLSWEAYCSVKGRGYTRIDIRMDKETKQLFVLEVNAQCGISEDEDFTSIGAILRLSDKTFSQLVTEIIKDAVARTPVLIS
jgi:D-alanine-D-alanine ligase